MTAPALCEHFFRHEYGRLVAVLSHRVGLDCLEAVEDAVQTALLKGLDAWTASGPPDNPSAWLYRVAHNQLMGDFRQTSGRRKLLEREFSETAEEVGSDTVEHRLAGELEDDLLRMLFACCDEAIPPESQQVMALKILCGFSVREIALRLFTSEANVYKRLQRARKLLRDRADGLGELTPDDHRVRLPTVTKVLYLLFTEGYLSSHVDFALRHDLCDEAIRLAEILAGHPLGGTPETQALVALMHLHRARMSARQDGSGGLLLLEDQDRSRWDRERIHTGLGWLALSARGDHFSRYHAEAGIAAEHCLAASLRDTRWERVVACYALLERQAPSPLHTLNRAIALAEWQGAAAGLALLESEVPPPWLADSYLWAAVLADLHQRCGNAAAHDYRRKALRAAPTPAIRSLLERRFDRCNPR